MVIVTRQDTNIFVKEFTMIKPGQFAKYIEFTQDEIKMFCKKHDGNFDKMKQHKVFIFQMKRYA